MKVQYDGFEWDEGNMGHCAKHGVSRSEVEYVLENMAFLVPDPHRDEPRMRTAGLSKEGRHVFIVFTFRDRNDGRYVPPISARYMGEKEVKAYERSR